MNTRRTTTGVVAAVAGALAAVASLAIAYGRHPALVLDMGSDAPYVTSGFYPVERAGDLTFAWTGERASVTLAGANRDNDWRCAIRLRGAHPNNQPPVIVVLDIDGQASEPRMLGNDFETLEVRAPARATPGLRLTLTSQPTFVPGPGDRRRLGAQVDEVRCAPDGMVWPTRGGALRAAAAPALFGAAAAIAGGGAVTATGIAVLVAGTQSLPFSKGAAPYSTTYQETLLWTALWLAAAVIGIAIVVERRRGATLTSGEGLILMIPAAAAYLKLVALLHPAKPLVDALFHAHRLEWVLDGRWFFTQPIQTGVQFPYAIGLYLFAAPFTELTRDYVTLLRVVSVAGEAVAGGLLGLMAARGWQDARAGAVAVLLYLVVPLPYEVLGNANLTNFFGQAVALMTIACATLWPLGTGRAIGTAGWIALASLALLSHVSTFSLLTVTLLSLAGLYVVVGGRDLRGSGFALGAGTIVAVVLAVALYYGHFGDAYRSLQAARAQAPVAMVDGDTTVAPPRALNRVTRAGTIALEALGWPVVALGAIGVAGPVRRSRRNRVTLAVGAWLLGLLVFTVVGTMTTVDPRYVRYADEFLARTMFATYPAIVLLAASGVSWLWRFGWPARLGCVALIGWATAQGAVAWIGWLSPS